MMTREEILKEIDKIEYRRWMLSLKDNWNRDDRTWDDEQFNRLITLREMLKEAE